ncbi:MAG: methyltransferase [Tannerellaceae bacterium]|nr:methyltransferase [Tannerellaceae bacterium]
MAKDYFRFKLFTVRQDRCAMKVGVDGTLLGAWAGVDGCRRVLDVGAGTGLIALMLAQRNTEVGVDAVDIDGEACRQAAENVAGSPFAGRVCVWQASFADFVSRVSSKYDLVVSNPPYFVRSLRNPDPLRSIARHTVSLSAEDILSKHRELLGQGGRIALILPAAAPEGDPERMADENGMYVTRRTSVVTLRGAGVKRVLAEFSPIRLHACVSDTLVIEEAHGLYSSAYVELTKDFYLNF